MEQYIKKSAVIAELEKLYNGEIDTYTRNILDKLNSNINNLEVKKVNLEEDTNDFIKEEYHYEEYEGKWVDEKDWRDSIQRCAKHFFELGMAASNKTQKGEEI